MATKFTAQTGKAYVTKAKLSFYSQSENFYSFKNGFKIATEFARTPNSKHGFGHIPVGLRYFGGRDRKEVTMLKMRLWLTEQGIQYTLYGDDVILLTTVEQQNATALGA